MAHKIIRDAVHDIIAFHREAEHPAHEASEWGDALLLELIDTPPLQRLRRISQLGHASRIYPCAEHSRFSHALGATHLAKRILTALLHRQPGLLTPAEILAIKVAALLHDVGHGPYSHVFEHLFAHSSSHESWGLRIVQEDPSITAALQRHSQRLKLDWPRFRDGLLATMGHHSAGETSFVRQIISSQLDADRMDYLLRDAHFTGVSYGRYDLEWLLHSLRVREVEGRRLLCVDISRGPAALESYVMARDHMYRQVYDHKTVRAFEVLLIHLFRTLERYWQHHGCMAPETPPELARFLTATFQPQEAPSVADFLAMDDALFDYAINHWASMLRDADPLFALLRWKCQMLRDRQPIYRRLYWSTPGEPWEGSEPGPSDLIHDPEAAEAVDRFFRDHADTPIGFRDPVSGLETQQPLALFAFVDCLERAPYGALPYAPDKAEPIYVIDGLERVLPAEQASSRIELLGRTPRRLVRVFADPVALTAIQRLVRERFAHPKVLPMERQP